jgi:hypothetical protein
LTSVDENSYALSCRPASILLFAFSEPVTQEKHKHNQKNTKVKVGIHFYLLKSLTIKKTLP